MSRPRLPASAECRLPAALLLVAWLVATGCSDRDSTELELRTGVGEAGDESARNASMAPPRRPAGRPAARIDREWLAAARSAMGQAIEGSCGPYGLLTDVREPGFRATCERIGSRLEEVYRARFGLVPVGEPAGVVLLFRQREDFRRFASQVAGLRIGHAGFSRPARGLVALPADEDLFATTLAHELVHLVQRRALGSDLPPWLAEGMADAIGDAAGEEGLGELTGVAGAEGQAARLAAAYAGARPPRLADLAGRGRGEFDRAVRSFDYEQSALLVRMLLLDQELSLGFRRFLAILAAGERYRAAALPRALGESWDELDQRLANWIAAQLSLA